MDLLSSSHSPPLGPLLAPSVDTSMDMEGGVSLLSDHDLGLTGMGKMGVAMMELDSVTGSSSSRGGGGSDSSSLPVRSLHSHDLLSLDDSSDPLGMDFGLLPSHSHSASSEPLLLHSHSPLMLSSGAPLIGSMMGLPQFSLGGDSLGHGGTDAGGHSSSSHLNLSSGSSVGSSSSSLSLSLLRHSHHSHPSSLSLDSFSSSTVHPHSLLDDGEDSGHAPSPSGVAMQMDLDKKPTSMIIEHMQSQQQQHMEQYQQLPQPQQQQQPIPHTASQRSTKGKSKSSAHAAAQLEQAQGYNSASATGLASPAVAAQPAPRKRNRSTAAGTSGRKQGKKAAAAAAANSSAAAASAVGSTTENALSPSAAASSQAGGVPSHSSDRKPSPPSSHPSHPPSLHPSPALPPSSTPSAASSPSLTASLLPSDIHTSTDEVQLQSALDTLVSTLSAQSRSQFLPRYLKLSLAELQKELTWLQNDIKKKRAKFASILTNNGNLSHRKGAAAALMAAAASLGVELVPGATPANTTGSTPAQQGKESGSGATTAVKKQEDESAPAVSAPAISPSTSSVAPHSTTAAGSKRARKSSLGVANAVASLKRPRHNAAAAAAANSNNNSATSTPAATTANEKEKEEETSSSAASAVAASPSAVAAVAPASATSPHSRSSKFAPASSPTLGQLICICRKPYDGTPVSGVPATNLEESSSTTSAVKSESTESSAVKMEVEPTVKIEPGTGKAESDSTNHHMEGDERKEGMDIKQEDTDMRDVSTTTGTAPAAADAAAASPTSSSTSSSLPAASPASASSTPPLPYLLPCQRCSNWFHPTCLRLSPLEALTPYVCRKHPSASMSMLSPSVEGGGGPILRHLMRPTSSRHERLLEREQKIELLPPNVLSPSSAYYLPEPLDPCPPLPDDQADEVRDNRLFAALREMMHTYHLSQHDVCISSNLSGGQAALSSMINARKIANIGRKQNQLRKWLWKFECFQRLKSDHALRYHLPRPAVGANLATAMDPPMRHPDGTLVQVGSVVAGHTDEWPPRITWRSYFEELTPEEKMEDEAKRMEALRVHQEKMQQAAQAKAAAKAKAASVQAQRAAQHAAQLAAARQAALQAKQAAAAEAKAANAASGNVTDTPDRPADIPSPLPRLRTVHYTPAKYAQSASPTPDSGASTPVTPAAATPSSAAASSSSSSLSTAAAESTPVPAAGSSSSSSVIDGSTIPPSTDIDEDSVTPPPGYSPFDPLDLCSPKGGVGGVGGTTKRPKLMSLLSGAPPDSFSHFYNIGDKVDCRVTPASDAPWLSCLVRDVRSCQVLLHFFKTSDQYDQWVNTRSKRLGEFGQYASPAGGNTDKWTGQWAGLSQEEIVKLAWKEYVKAEKQAAKEGYTDGAPLWSGKKRPDLALKSNAARRKAAAAAAASSSSNSSVASSASASTSSSSASSPKAGSVLPATSLEPEPFGLDEDKTEGNETT